MEGQDALPEAFTSLQLCTHADASGSQSMKYSIGACIRNPLALTANRHPRTAVKRSSSSTLHTVSQGIKLKQRLKLLD
jgi:hypothetical protein